VERVRPDDGDDRTVLTAHLDWHRSTVRMKCQGLDEVQAHTPRLPSSPLMTVAGVVSHLRWVEHWWFEHRLLGEPDRRPWTDDDPDAEMRVDDIPLAQLLDEYAEQCTRSRQIASGLGLDLVEALPPAGQPGRSLRWILTHMVGETARHNGHLDAIRELTDGVTGY